MAKLTIQFDGFKDMMERIDKLGGSIQEATEEALEATADIVYPKMQQAIKAHHRTGDTEKSLYKSDVVWVGNKAHIKCGFKWDKGGYVAIFLNYGTPRNEPADPSIITKPLAISRSKNTKEIQKQIIMKHLERVQK